MPKHAKGTTMLFATMTVVPLLPGPRVHFHQGFEVSGDLIATDCARCHRFRSS